MSETTKNAETTKVTEVTEPTESTEQGKPAETDEAALGDAGKKALDRMKAERNEAKQEAAALKARLDKLEAANMTELERAQKEAQEAKAEVEKIPSYVADHLRDHLTELHSISAEDRELYLTSNDPATLLKQAVGIAARTSTNPKPDLSQGAQHPHALNGDGLTQALERAVGRRT
jgi:hypothetical protein